MEADGPHPLAVEIRTLAFTIFKAAKRDLERRLELHGVEVGGLPYGVMRFLHYGDYTISDLSREMHIKPATLVPVIDTLERHGLVTRGQDPKDRRRIPLSLTEHGAQVVARVPLVDRDDVLVRGLNAMGDERCLQLLSLLRELEDYVSEKEVAAEEATSTVDLSAAVLK
ncbi:MAG: MarR family transcriptional regulator [Bacteroidetes bacterium]|nr:MarR family transcriptional regulator [Bacteroidota bacterium]